MYRRETILLKLYFPQFNSPINSRFQTFFILLNNIDITKNKKKKLSNRIYPDMIMQGEDKRTSIIIKNIPNNMKKKDIRKMIEKYGNINFLALSKDEEKEYYIIAYLNVINYKSIVPIYMALRNVNFNFYGNILNIEIFYSDVQGKNELKNLFKNKYFEN